MVLTSNSLQFLCLFVVLANAAAEYYHVYDEVRSHWEQDSQVKVIGDDGKWHIGKVLCKAYDGEFQVQYGDNFEDDHDWFFPYVCEHCHTGADPEYIHSDRNVMITKDGESGKKVHSLSFHKTTYTAGATEPRGSLTPK